MQGLGELCARNRDEDQIYISYCHYSITDAPTIADMQDTYQTDYLAEEDKFLALQEDILGKWCVEKTGTPTKTCAQVFIVSLLTIARRWKQPKVHQWMNGETRCTCTTAPLFSVFTSAIRKQVSLPKTCPTCPLNATHLIFSRTSLLDLSALSPAASNLSLPFHHSQQHPIRSRTSFFFFLSLPFHSTFFFSFQPVPWLSFSTAKHPKRVVYVCSIHFFTS